jgi:hypothetical protein
MTHTVAWLLTIISQAKRRSKPPVKVRIDCPGVLMWMN